MRTRTRLTTPPGEEPVAEDGVRTRDPERYSPALRIPSEPDVPGRYRKAAIVAIVLLAVAGLAYLGFQLANAGQFQDPSLDEDPGIEQPAQPTAPTADPTPAPPGEPTPAGTTPAG